MSPSVTTDTGDPIRIDLFEPQLLTPPTPKYIA